MDEVAVSNTRRTGLLRGIVRGGLSAGVLDIANSLIVRGMRGISPLRILQSIESTLLGRAASLASFH